MRGRGQGGMDELAAPATVVTIPMDANADEDAGLDAGLGSTSPVMMDVEALKASF